MNCPVCKIGEGHHFLHVKDYTVSHKTFELQKCNNCGFVFTLDPPGQDEIGQYYQSDNYISHTNSSKGIQNKLYQLVRGFALKQKVRLIKKTSKKNQGIILDYGCGTGNFLCEIKKSGWAILGIEPDASARKTASELSGEKINTPDHLKNSNSEHFDVITLWHVLEHVHQLDDLLSTFKRILKKGAYIIIAVPNLDAWDASYYKEYWAAYDVPRHLYHFNPKSMDRLLSQYGFKHISTNPMWFDAFYVSLLSEKYKNGKTNYLSSILIGMLSNIRAVFQSGKCSSQIYIYQNHIN